MCIIIDTNRIGEVLSKTEDALPVLDWLKKPNSHLAIGGTKLNDEYKKIPKFVALLSVLNGVGKIRRFDSSEVDAEHKKIEESGAMSSDDPHILGLAAVSRCRLLYSDDEALHEDFTNTKIMKPKGKVYQYKTHKHLLNSASKCL